MPLGRTGKGGKKRGGYAKENPVVAAILSFIFGPLGYLYVGWRYAIMALAVLLTFVLVPHGHNFPIPPFNEVRHPRCV